MTVDSPLCPFTPLAGAISFRVSAISMSCGAISFRPFATAIAPRKASTSHLCCGCACANNRVIRLRDQFVDQLGRPLAPLQVWLDGGDRDFRQDECRAAHLGPTGAAEGAAG